MFLGALEASGDKVRAVQREVPAPRRPQSADRLLFCVQEARSLARA